MAIHSAEVMTAVVRSLALHMPRKYAVRAGHMMIKSIRLA